MRKAFNTLNILAIIASAILTAVSFNTLRNGFEESTTGLVASAIYLLLVISSLVFIILERKINKLCIHIISIVICGISFNILGLISAIFGLIICVSKVKEKTIPDDTNETENIVKVEYEHKENTKLEMDNGVLTLYILSIVMGVILIFLYCFVVIKYAFSSIGAFLKSVMEEKSGWAFWNLFLVVFYGCFYAIVLLIPINIYILLIGRDVATIRTKDKTMFITSIVFGFLSLMLFDAIGSIVALINNNKTHEK
jgi:hypothetical protein